MGVATDFLLSMTPEQQAEFWKAWEAALKAERREQKRLEEEEFRRRFRLRQNRKAEESRSPYKEMGKTGAWVLNPDGELHEIGMPTNGENRAHYNLGNGCRWRGHGVSYR